MMLATSLALLNLIVILIMLGINICGFILFVKLANRGIKALDIFIEKHKE